MLESCLEYNFQAVDLKTRFEEKLNDNLTQFSIQLCNNSNDAREFGLNIKLDQSNKSNSNCFEVKIENIYTLFFVPPY